MDRASFLFGWRVFERRLCSFVWTDLYHNNSYDTNKDCNDDRSNFLNVFDATLNYSGDSAFDGEANDFLATARVTHSDQPLSERGESDAAKKYNGFAHCGSFGHTRPRRP